MTIAVKQKLKVAIVGAGPGGLAAAIFLRRLDFIHVTILDQATTLTEIGAGIQINENTWRLLVLLGAAPAIEQFTQRAKEGALWSQRRNGRTGELLREEFIPKSVAGDNPPSSRIERTKLQRALLEQLPEDFVILGKKLKSIAEGSSGTTLTLSDGSVIGPFDLVIGSDGIRSIVRSYIYPDHRLFYTGKVAYRVFLPQEKVAHIQDLPRVLTWWQTPTTHVYTNFIDNGLFEISVHVVEESEEYGKKVSWGQKAKGERVTHHTNFNKYCDTVKRVIEVPDEWLEFALFGGPRLPSVVHNGNIALIGDASHPLSGAFGTGAALAFEDAYVLAYALEQAHKDNRPLSAALDDYDEIRSPRYSQLYDALDRAKSVQASVNSLRLPEDEALAESSRRSLDIGSIYAYDVAKVVSEWEAGKPKQLRDHLPSGIEV